jgi:hypothetical protein
VVICRDPFGARGGWSGQWQIENPNSLPGFIVTANRNNLAFASYIDFLHDNIHSENTRRERHGKMLLEHGKKPDCLLLLGVSVDDRASIISFSLALLSGGRLISGSGFNLRMSM